MIFVTSFKFQRFDDAMIPNLRTDVRQYGYYNQIAQKTDNKNLNHVFYRLLYLVQGWTSVAVLSHPSVERRKIL